MSSYILTAKWFLLSNICILIVFAAERAAFSVTIEEIAPTEGSVEVTARLHSFCFIRTFW